MKHCPECGCKLPKKDRDEPDVEAEEGSEDELTADEMHAELDGLDDELELGAVEAIKGSKKPEDDEEEDA